MKHIKTYESFMSKDTTIFALEGSKFAGGTIDVTFKELEELIKMGLVKWTTNWFKKGSGLYVYKKEKEEEIKKHLELINSDYYKNAPKYNL